MAIVESIQIPSSQREGLLTLFLMKESDFQKLAEAMGKLPPYLIEHSKLKALLVRESDGSVPNDTLGGVFDIVMSLRKDIYEDDTISEELKGAFAEGVVDTIIEDNRKQKQKINRELAIKRINTLVHSQRLNEWSIADTSLHENSHSYQSAKIITDVRTIFDQENDNSFIGTTLVHNLKISYRSQIGMYGRTENFFVSLDTNDLQLLKEAIECAQEQNKQITDMLEKQASTIYKTEIER